MKLKNILLLLGLLALLLCGCSYEEAVDTAIQDLAQQMTKPEDIVEPFVGFCETEAEHTDELRQLKPEELEKYTSEYSKYNSYTYFAYLNDTEKLLYRAYEYALAEGLPYLWIDDRLLLGMERTPFDVLEFLTLDSAVVEQNISYTLGSVTMTHTVMDVPTASETYTTISVENFTQKRLENKNNAILQAKIILEEKPGWESTPHRELAEYFYDYLGENVSYETDIKGEEYLYTALCEGRTNCDGYANTFALLCRLADIPCIEIHSDTPEGEEGHTWNMIYIEDKWVHVDGTGARDDVYSECENQCQERINFGFPDKLLRDQMLYADLLPDCPEGLSPILEISSANAYHFKSSVVQSFRENEDKFAVVLVEDGDLDDETASELVNELGFALYYSYYETAEEKTVYYLFNNEP